LQGILKYVRYSKTSILSLEATVFLLGCIDLDLSHSICTFHLNVKGKGDSQKKGFESVIFAENAWVIL
jgi:hypothetical protein